MTTNNKFFSSKRFFILSSLLNLIVILSLIFYFDDEIKDLFKMSTGNFFEKHTLSPNVSIHKDMAHFTALKRFKTLRIYTPANYNESDKRYPVMYLFGGNSLFDEKHSNRGEWNVDETLDKAIKNGGEEMIIIGIDLGEHRNRELNPYDRQNQKDNENEKLISFVINELKPMIDSKYRTLADRENTAIGGASLGGLFSFYTIMKHPEVFSKAAVLSPSFVYSDQTFLMPQQLENKDIKIYMNVGDHEFVGMITVMKLMERSLKEAGFTDQNLKTKMVKGGGHDPKTWRDGFAESYQFLFN